MGDQGHQVGTRSICRGPEDSEVASDERGRDGADERDVALAYERLGDAEGELGNPSASLEAHQHGLEIRKELLQQDPQDWNVKTSITYSLTSIGQQEMTLAQMAQTSVTAQHQYWDQARDTLQQAVRLWHEIYAHRQTTANKQTEVKELQQLITQCETRLKKLGSQVTDSRRP